MQPIDELDDSLITDILKAGRWSSEADDNIALERLPEGLVAGIVGRHRADPDSPAALAGLALLVLTMSAGRWGVEWNSANPPGDPAKDGWKGPASVAQGKHLMSYTIGGLGIPHLDTGSAIRFLDELAARIPEATPAVQQLKPNFVYDTIRNEAGPRWQLLKKWSLEGLRRRDLQAWILKDWINRYWLPAYNAVMSEPHGSFKEALVVARIWNTSPADGRKALDAAKGKTAVGDRIEAELAKYAEGSATRRRRVPVMRRPGVVYDFVT